MSRWISAAEIHPFKKSWESLLDAVQEPIIDETADASLMEELARLKKVLAFLENLISSLDFELVPLSLFSNCQQSSDNCLQNIRQYQATKNYGYLVNSNEYADALISYLRPYISIPDGYLKAHGIAQKKYVEQVNEYIGSFEQAAKKAQSALSIANGEAAAQKKRIDEIEAKIKGFNDYLFLNIDEQGSTEQRIKSMVEKVTTDQKSVSDLHDKLLLGPESTAQLIGGYQRDIDNLRNRLTELTNSSEKEHEELKQFYQRVFGSSPGVDGKVDSIGLKQEIDDRLKQLGVFEGEHQTRHNAMFEKVESLLPGATSAGLATAYKSLKDSFNKPIKNYTIAFYCALVVLLLSGLFMIIDFTSDPLKIELVKAHDWTEMLKTLLVRAPVVIPVVWFAVFSATRRSQYERLQQEYAHKEALASSYEGYKKQLQDLKGDAEDLQKELIAKSINAIAYNASTTLDGKHTEKPPVFQMLEKLNADDIKKMIDMVRQK